MPEFIHRNKASLFNNQLIELPRSSRKGCTRSGICLEKRYPPVIVTADEMNLSVFRNLFAKAVQQKDMKTAGIDLPIRTRNGEVEITIANDGPGIPDARREEVFGCGVKGLESSGTRLGLYLVDTLVDAYGGRVWITDTEPTGSVFHVVPPIAR